MRCDCPDVICKYYDNCAACVAHHRMNGDLCHCMEKAAIQQGVVMPLCIPETYLEDDFDLMSRRSAELVRAAIREKPDALVSLPAGSTASRTYVILKEMSDAGELDFSNTRFVALDEWLDLADESENCDAFMRKHFYTPLGIPDAHVTRFDIHAADLDDACKAVDDVIFAHGGIDLMLLGVGMNGHLGLNEPNSDFSLYSKVVTLDPATMRVGQKYFSNQMALTRGITLGIRHLFDCRRVILQVGGSHKADIMEKVYRCAPTEEIPATVIKLLPQGIVVIDRDAASKVLDLLDPALGKIPGPGNVRSKRPPSNSGSA